MRIHLLIRILSVLFIFSLMGHQHVFISEAHARDKASRQAAEYVDDSGDEVDDEVTDDEGEVAEAKPTKSTGLWGRFKSAIKSKTSRQENMRQTEEALDQRLETLGELYEEWSQDKRNSQLRTQLVKDSQKANKAISKYMQILLDALDSYAAEYKKSRSKEVIKKRKATLGKKEELDEKKAEFQSKYGRFLAENDGEVTTSQKLKGYFSSDQAEKNRLKQAKNKRKAHKKTQSETDDEDIAAIQKEQAEADAKRDHKDYQSQITKLRQQIKKISDAMQVATSKSKKQKLIDQRIELSQELKRLTKEDNALVAEYGDILDDNSDANGKAKKQRVSSSGQVVGDKDSAQKGKMAKDAKGKKAAQKKGKAAAADDDTMTGGLFGADDMDAVPAPAPSKKRNASIAAEEKLEKQREEKAARLEQTEKSLKAESPIVSDIPPSRSERAAKEEVSSPSPRSDTAEPVVAPQAAAALPPGGAVVPVDAPDVAVGSSTSRAQRDVARGGDDDMSAKAAKVDSAPATVASTG